MKKVLLAAINSKYIHTNLAVRYIKKYVEEYSEQKIGTYETSINNSISEVIRDIYDRAPDVVIFSTYIWNKEYVFKLIKEVRKILPETEIVLGGPEVSYDSVSVMKERAEIDYIISGEGERSTLNFLTKDIDEVSGVYYRDPDNRDEIRYNGNQEPIENLDEIPFPYTMEELRGNGTKILYYESSRGCPFACSYCMSSIERSVRYFSSERTKEDLKKFLDSGIKLVKFVDRTFNLKKERYMDIWRYLLSVYSEDTTFHFEISADLFDDEVIEFLEGVPKDYFQFEIGVQTSNERTMEAIKRRNDLEKLEHNVERIKDNIHLHLDLIAGLPYEDYTTFKRSFNYVHDMYPEMVQLGFLKILKGTQISTEIEEFDYKYMEFPPYEVLANKFISYREITMLKDIEGVLDHYYNSEKFERSLKFILENHYESSFDFYEEMALYFREKGYFQMGHKLVAIFNHFYEFYRSKDFDKLEIFTEHLKYDYLMLGKPGSYPYWFVSHKDKEKYNNTIENLQFKSAREAHKKTEIERFSYNVLTGKEDQVDLLFIYEGREVKVQEC